MTNSDQCFVALWLAALVSCGHCQWRGYPCMTDPTACKNGGTCMAATNNEPEQCKCTDDYLGHDCGHHQGWFRSRFCI